MRKIVSRLYIGLVAGFIIYLLVRDSKEFFSAITTASPLLLVAALLVNILALLLQSQTWAWIQRAACEGHKLTFWNWTRLFLIGYLGRYVPGKVTLIVGRVIALAPYGYGRGSVVYAALVENISFLLAALSVGFSIGLLGNAPFLVALPTPAIWSIGVGLLLSVAIGLSSFGEKILDAVLIRYSGPTSQLQHLSWPTKLGVLALGMFTNLLLGLSFALIVWGLTDSELSLHSVLIAAGAFPVAVGAGVLALFAPSGLGVREGASVAFLANIVSPQIALLAGLIMRVMMCLVELGLYGAALLCSTEIEEKGS